MTSVPMSSLDRLAESQRKHFELLRENAKTAYLEAISEWFQLYPRAQEISWDQYTPYFMDGDPCVFGLMGISVNGCRQWEEPDTECQNAIAAHGEMCRSLENLLYKCEDALEFAFGDHATVSVNRKGEVTIEHCEHD